MDHKGAQSVSRIRLLEAAPQIGHLLGAEERDELQKVTLAVHAVPEGEFEREWLREAGAFGAIILDGILLHRLTLWDHPTLRLLGRGDMLAYGDDAEPGLGGHSDYRAVETLRLVMLDDRVLYIAHRVPRLFAALHQRAGEQQDRLATQLVICQLPRVDDRILGILWLLAETWGHVTTAGTVLPIALTHDALGELIGARRPTVSLALKDLSERGKLIRQDDGWLLLEPLPAPGEPAPALREDAVKMRAGSDPAWRSSPPVSIPDPAELERLIATLRDSHARASADYKTRLQGSHRLRAETRALRQARASRRSQQDRRPAP